MGAVNEEEPDNRNNPNLSARIAPIAINLSSRDSEEDLRPRFNSIVTGSFYLLQRLKARHPPVLGPRRRQHRTMIPARLHLALKPQRVDPAPRLQTAAPPRSSPRSPPRSASTTWPWPHSRQAPSSLALTRCPPCRFLSVTARTATNHLP
jgi:hypothetical protein